MSVNRRAGKGTTTSWVARQSAPLSATSLTRLQRMLLGADGTVTHILEAYADEPIEAIKLHQEFDTRRPTDGALDLPEGAAVLRREVVLRGRRSRRNLLYASAVLAVGRIAPKLLEVLVSTDQPIGRVLVANRIETFREILEVGRGPAEAAGAHFGALPTAELISRTYRILSQGQPLMVITERFPAHFFLELPAGGEVVHGRPRLATEDAG